VRVLGRRPVTDPAELATVVAECLPHLDPGLRLLERAANAGEVTVDIACVDGARRLVLILCDIVAGPDAVLRAVEGAAWWREHPELLPRVFPAAAALDAGAPPRTLLVACRFGDRALRLLRALGPLGPEPVECRVFTDETGTVVSLERVDVAAAPARAAAAPEPAAPPAAARPVAPAPETPAPAAGPVERPAASASQLIDRLERLRFSEVFR